MKTIHIKGIGLKEGWLKRWYKEFLNKDSKFHFVYWENGRTHKAMIEGKNILIRLEDNKIIEDFTNWLKQKQFNFEIYDYPYTRKKFQLGLFKKSWEDRHFEISQILDNVCSKAALELNEKDWHRFIQQIFHIACNTRGYDHYTQTQIMIQLLKGSLETYRYWTIANLKEMIEDKK